MSIALDKITKARTQLLLDNPFFGHIAMRLDLIETDQFETMATDGKHIYFSPDFVGKHSNAHLKGVIAHEICHVMLKHHLRRGQRNPSNWNTACDYAINPILIDAGFSLPESGLIDMAWRGQSAEDIHRALFQDQDQPPADGGEGGGESTEGGDKGDAEGKAQGDASDSPENSGSEDNLVHPTQSGKSQPVDLQGHGVVLDGTKDDGSALTTSDLQEQEDLWTEIVLNTAMISGEAGKADSPFKQQIDMLKKPKVDWRNVMRRFLTSGQPSVRSFHRLNRRSRVAGCPLPSRRRDVGGTIAALFDVSSSVDDEMFAQFCEELQSIASEFDITTHVIKYTHSVRDVQVVEAGDEIDRTRYYGGTNTKAAFDYVEENDLDVDAIVVFSDCEDHYDKIIEPSCPTLIGACIDQPYWLENLEKQASWAEVVQISR